jgi:hypothetical protein
MHKPSLRANSALRAQLPVECREADAMHVMCAHLC